MNKEKLPNYWSFWQEDMMAYLAIPTNEGRGEVLTASILYFLNRESEDKPKAEFTDATQMLAYAKSIRDIDRSYHSFRGRQIKGYKSKVGSYPGEEIPPEENDQDAEEDAVTPSVPYEELETEDKRLEYQRERLKKMLKGK